MKSRWKPAMGFVLAKNQNGKCFTCGNKLKWYRGITFSGPLPNDRTCVIKFSDELTGVSQKPVAVCEECRKKHNNTQPTGSFTMAELESKARALKREANELMKDQGIPERTRTIIASRLVGAGRIAARVDQMKKYA